MNPEQEQEQPIGLIDMDGTLYDYHEKLKADLRAIMSPGEVEPEDIFSEREPWMKARMDLIKSQVGWWRDLPKLRLGWQVYEVAEALGFDIQILTKGPASKSRAWAEKLECIQRDLGDVTVNIVGRDKRGYYGHFLCDDYEPFLRGWLKHRPRGLGILIDNPSNRDFNHPNVLRFSGDTEELARYLRAVRARLPHEHWREYL